MQTPAYPFIIKNAVTREFIDHVTRITLANEEQFKDNGDGGDGKFLVIDFVTPQGDELLFRGFDADGKFIAQWNDGGRLNAPCGMALAPANFGTASNRLLVGNVGDYDEGGSHGAIAAFDKTTRKVVDVLRDATGKPLLVPGIWEMVFGNGYTLGDSNALYDAAGPNDELDGLFGVIRQVDTP